MPSGKEKGQDNLQAWLSLRAQRPDPVDWRALANGSKLNRVGLAELLGCGKSALNQNPRIAASLAATEEWLREAGVLLSLEHQPGCAEMPNRTPAASQRQKRIEAENEKLRNENAALRLEVQTLRDGLRRYDLLETVLSETMRIPR